MTSLLRAARLRVLLLGIPAVLCLPEAVAAGAVESTLSAVTVYPDRAVVTRKAVVDIAAAGPAEAVFEKLPASLDEQSLRVSGSGAVGVTILDVAAQKYRAAVAANQRVRALEAEIQGLKSQGAVLVDRLSGLTSRAGMLERIEASATGGKRALSLDEATKWMEFLSGQRDRIAAERRAIDEQSDELAKKEMADERLLAELQPGRDNTYERVAVRFTAAAAGRFALTLAYEVPDASWAPAYDARVSTADRSVELAYFGVVRQHTGEDWDRVALTLSTARPSLGGSPPPLSPWTLDVIEPHPWPGPAAGPYFGRVAPEFIGRQEAMMPKIGPVAFDALNFATGALVPAAKQSCLAPAALESHLASASFRIPAGSTIPSDDSSRKVPIATARLAIETEYQAIPKQAEDAFLAAKATNTSAYPLLGGPMNVFLDEAFVASGALPTVMPGEKFQLALGAGDGVAVSRKLIRRFAEDTGIVNKGRRVSYEFALTVENHKGEAQKVVVFDQVPVSRDAKIAVRVLAPAEGEAEIGSDGTVKWTLTLSPGEKRELPLKFEVSHPSDVLVAGLE